MATIGGNNSVQDGLVFHYDTGNKRKSFKGEPTVNLAENKQQAGNTYGDQTGDFVFSDAPEKGPRWKKVRILRTHSNHYLCKLPYINHPDLETRTYSMEYDFNGYDDIFTWNLGGYGANATETHTGKYVSTTYTPTDGGGLLSFILSMGNNLPYDTNVDYTIYYRDYQVEQKDHATPFVGGTRTATDSLIDLTGQNTLDVSTVSFDSNGMYFDGVDDKISIPSSENLNFGTNDFTIEFVANKTAGGFQSGTYVNKGLGTSTGFGMRDGNLYIHSSIGEIARCGLGTTLNTFEHHVFTFTQTSSPYIKHYINGELLNSSTNDNINNLGSISNATPFDVGFSNAGGVQRYFDGELPIVRLYREYLTPQEIKRNFNSYKGRFNII